MTEIVAGLAEGERLVASGQFLIDSEASLSGMAARAISGERPSVPPASTATAPAPSVANGHAGHGGAAQ